jgi:hypothetical protein
MANLFNGSTAIRNDARASWSNDPEDGSGTGWPKIRALAGRLRRGADLPAGPGYPGRLGHEGRALRVQAPNLAETPFRPLEPDCKVVQFDQPLTPEQLRKAGDLIVNRSKARYATSRHRAHDAKNNRSIGVSAPRRALTHKGSSRKHRLTHWLTNSGVIG